MCRSMLVFVRIFINLASAEDLNGFMDSLGRLFEEDLNLICDMVVELF